MQYTNRAIPSESGSLEHLASVQTVTVLKESDVVLSDVVNQVTGSVDMSQCDFVMILIVDNVDKISIEGMDIVELGEVLKDFSELFMDILTAELDLSHVERSDSGDVITGMDDSWGLSLCFGKDDVDKVSGGGDDLDLLEVIIHVPGCVDLSLFCLFSKFNLDFKWQDLWN